MIVTFLGTGTSQGIPVIACDCKVCHSLDFKDHRTRTSAHIQIDNVSLVIDTGPDFRQQILRERIIKVDAVIFTHQHRDHTAGLDEIRSFNFKQDIEMPIYARDSVLNQLKKEFAYIFSEVHYPGVPRVTPHVIDGQNIEIEGTTVIPIEVLHYRLPIYGFRIGDFTYVTDASFIAPEQMSKIFGTRVLVLNALQKDEHISHFNLDGALKVIEEIAPEKAYLTHISHRLGRHGDVEKGLPPNVAIAYDGLKVKL